MKLQKSILVASAAALLLAGCYKEPGLVEDGSYNRTATGAVGGAVAGSMLAYNTGSRDAKSAIIGGLLGAALGGAIGYSMDEQANEMARALGTGVNNDPLAALDPNKTIIVSKHSNYVKIMFRDRMMFASNSATLQSSARSKVNKVSQLLAKYPQTVVGVAGFTDNSGSYDYNQKLSQRRANSVASLLSRNGRPNTKGCSYSKALVPNNSAKNKALNRRVEVYLYSDKNKMSDPCR
ncbi:MAG: OmpA family protein [Sulfurovum sp.]|nr:OmpA family protein [Sulfurovum sp.]